MNQVVVPAVYKEWTANTPEVSIICFYEYYLNTRIYIINMQWATSEKIQAQHNFTVFMYQKLDPSKSNYVVNRGSEGGVYLRYIVDHYDDLPDIMVYYQ